MRNSLAPRDDKWYLGAGDGLVWAPPFPAWLAAPGFWDEAHLFQYAIRPLFTVTLLADGGAGLPPPPLASPSQCLRRRWTPAALTLEHALGRLRAREVRSAPGGSLASEWEVRNPTERAVTLDVVVWTAVDGASLAAADVQGDRHALRFTRVVTDRQAHRARVAHLLALAPAAQSFAAYRSEASTPTLPPRFDLTPFFDRWRRGGGLGNELHLEGIDPRGLVFLGLQRRFRIAPGARATFSASVSLALDGGGPPAGMPDGGEPRRPDRPRAAAERRWQEFFEIGRASCRERV